MIKVLYANPLAMVCTGNICSTQFPVSRGSHQGCPLSPLLFALSLEPLAQKIRRHPLVHPNTFCNTEHRISLYADDILLYVGNAGSSIPYLLSTFDSFSLLSGYKINWTTLALMHLNSVTSQTPLPSHIPIVKSFRYLGVDIFPFATKKFQGIYSRIEKDFERWSNLPVLGKASLIISKFIWKAKRPLLKFTTLQRAKIQGGLALPNFKVYFWSFVLRPLSTWSNPSSSVAWRPIEENISLPHRLQDLVYSDMPLKKAKLRLGPIISFLLTTCRTVMRHVHSDLMWHNHSPIFNNFSLLTGNIPFSFPCWRSRGIHVLKDLNNNNGL
uniref:Reverse transcriptase domain-containing protein n=1 Tax=Labrus bergylta TaxID=56723 RepID=A0A3Q3MY16_9LABR